jgi:hypothetical protein
MKHINIIFILALALAAACTQAPKTNLQTGDLVFVGLHKTAPDSSMSSAIASATGPEDSLEIVHVGIIDVSGDSVYVIDATIKHGVDRHPIDTLVTDFTRHDGTKPALLYKRLKDNSSAAEYVRNAKQRLGEKYDFNFLPDNGASYCSELVRDSYHSGDEYVFENKPMNFKGPDGEYPAYWEKLFAKMGVPIPQGIPGTNPRDMMHSPALADIQ